MSLEQPVPETTARRAHRDDAQVVESAPVHKSVLASFADPGPLGLAAFAMTTFVLSTVNAGLLPKAVEATVFGLAIFYGGIAQMLAGMWEFAKGNTFGATAFTSFGAFWISFWYLSTKAVPMMVAAGASAHDINRGVATYLLGWTILVAIMLIAAPHTNGVLVVVFALLFLTFLGLTIGAFAGNSSITHVAGWLGLLTAIAAFYGVLAGVLNGTSGRSALPTAPRH